MHGYTGKVLFVNLSTGEIQPRVIPDEVYENFLSGVGLGAYVLYQMIPAGADPLGPDNVLGFVSGLLTGTGSAITGRWMVVCKSPITGGWGDSNCGGNFSPAIKQCGYDGIFFYRHFARASLFIHRQQGRAVEIRRRHLGNGCGGSGRISHQNPLGTKKNPCVAVIGQAGENVSLISGVVNDGGRIAARSGGGAVMGSKRLKAVVLTGSKPIHCADPAGMKAISKELSEKIRKTNLPGFIPGSALSLTGALMGKMKKLRPHGWVNIRPDDEEVGNSHE